MRTLMGIGRGKLGRGGRWCLGYWCSAIINVVARPAGTAIVTVAKCGSIGKKSSACGGGKNASRRRAGGEGSGTDEMVLRGEAAGWRNLVSRSQLCNRCKAWLTVVFGYSTGTVLIPLIGVRFFGGGRCLICFTEGAACGGWVMFFWCWSWLRGCGVALPSVGSGENHCFAAGIRRGIRASGLRRRGSGISAYQDMCGRCGYARWRTLRRGRSNIRMGTLNSSNARFRL